ncbi:hypothetical protein BSL78_15903 [Apostichopus japonicus]|uniref:HAUS augmin-like complex subunit 2 n=1 Tax=Stichopus japonicus TaxID=307972 RepID=A0A2G8KGX1_STIJA|nr:hypothetical protein BSL78_15903 [Apostichopus japonicus]
MEEASSAFSNPWASEEPQTQALSNILRFAKGYGYKCDTDVGESKGLQQQLGSQAASLQMIDRLRQKTDQMKEINSISSSIQKRLMDKETRDITHQDILESKISTISSLNGHLQTILEKKQELTTRLQQPVIGDNLRVEAAYHDHVRELFPMITVHLARLNQNLETIQWSHDFKQTDDQLEESLNGIAGKLAQIQTGLQDIAQLRSTLQNF